MPSTITLVDLALPQTLSNKTLTAPIINGGTLNSPTITGSVTLSSATLSSPTITLATISNSTINTNNSTLDALRGYLGGLILSNDGVTPNTVLDVSAGVCCADDFSTIMKVSALTGTTGGTWIVGTGQPKLDAGTIAASTWYHVFSILRVDTGVSDILFSTSATSPTLPTNYTKKRRIGSFKTDGSSNILAFIQEGDYFRWATAITDVNATNPGTTAITRTLTTPLGIVVDALFTSILNGQTSLSLAALYSSLDETDIVPTVSNGNHVQNMSAASETSSNLLIKTNTLSQIRSRLNSSGASDVQLIVTRGWIDTRGRFA